MSRLTEEMVIARSKQSDIGVVKKLNCWGSELTDVSIIRRMRGVEVLALSVNKISTLSPFEECVNLQELYLRKNNIQDINDLVYLQNLPKLKFLWLEENPCVDQAGANYRAFVLRALPNLKKLDNVEVTPEEVEEAMRRDLRLSAPAGNNQQDFEAEQNHHNQQQEWQQESSPSRERQSPDNTESECISDPLDRDVSPSSPSQEQRNAQNLDNYSPAESNHPPSSPRYQNNNANNSRGQPYHQQYDRSPGSDHDYHNGRHHERARMAQSISTQSMKDYYRDPEYQRPPPANYRHSQHDLTEWNEDGGGNGPITNSTPRRSTEKPDMYAYRNGNSSREELDEQTERRRNEVKRAENRITDSTSVISNTVLNHLHGIHRRPMGRNSNLLSATLCLVKELDYPSLEVVEHAVRCRIDELTE
ncbi:hybrid signal transduction histidine kinase A isoform X2 [Culicoides brevitarsis]|uniref:hybrid signal transduction histidine kinase A isoform X2 n=1 Tax=Culicoides brevitarsis TaxID=469753 RepID=UPI00307C4023